MGMTPDEARRRLEEREEAARRELFAVLAHELRSPIGAILGFEELLSEGILGELPPTTDDALARIRGSARQLLDLVAGLSDLAADGADHASSPPEQVNAGELLDTVLHSLTPEAEGRGANVSMSGRDPLPDIITDTERVRRALQLAVMAAIKNAAGAHLGVHAAVEEDTLVVRIEGSRLDPRKDDPDISLHAHDRAHLTGAGLRVGMARSALAPLQGSLHLQPHPDSTSILILLPITRAG